jgi:thiamine-monophosphate kinase
VEPERNRLEVVTVDAIVEGVHFERRFTPPAAIGHRALAVNLSDIAAMGAAPRLALLSMALPPDLPCADFDAMIGALAALASSHKLHVVGGNLTRSPGPLMLDVTVIGTVKRREVLTRAGASPGDEIYVTGSLGGAAAGLALLKGPASGTGVEPKSTAAACIERYLYPQPRTRAGLLLGRNRAATACMDLSDGLGDGVRQIAEASGVGATVEEKAVPIDPGASLSDAISGGDDYELVFTVRPRLRGRLAAVRRAGLPITRIGVCTASRDVLLQRMSGAIEPLPAGFSHFR